MREKEWRELLPLCIDKPCLESGIEIFHWDITVFVFWFVVVVVFFKMRPENIMESPLNRNRANNFGAHHIRCEVS